MMEFHVATSGGSFKLINKSHLSSRTRPGCHVFGFWLDEKEVVDDAVAGRQFSLLWQSVKVYFGSIIKENAIPLVIPVEELNSGWDNGNVSYAFTVEYCTKLDTLSDAFRRNLISSDAVSSEEDSDSEPDDSNEQLEHRSDIHEVELTELNQRRRRVLRNADGQILSSCIGLSNPRQVRRNRRRLQNSCSDNSEFEAEKNTFE